MRSAVVVAAGIASLGFAADANAAYKLRLTSGATIITVTDEVVGDTAFGTPGFIGYSGPVGTWNITITSSRTKPNSGTAAKPTFTLTSNNTAGIGMLTIEATDTGYGPTNPPWNLAVNSADPDTQAVAYSAYYDTGNTEFAQTTQIGSTLTGSGIFNEEDTDNSVPALASPYSLTVVYTVTHASQGSSQFDGSLRAVPEPATLGVLGVGLFGLGWAARRRRRKMVS
jgi:hypothetical protein